MFFNDLSRNLGNEKKMSSIRLRKLSFEPLECREMLSVTAVEFNAIRAAYSDLNLSANMADYNVIEITADNLTDAALRSAIAEAGTTVANDLIVVRTTAEQNTVTLSGTELEVDFSATTRGSVTIVSFGSDRLTLDANQQSRVLLAGSDTLTSTEVALAGLTITGGKADIGGGVASYGTLTVTDCLITENSVSNSGGGICGAAKITVTNSTISKNEAALSGGGIFNTSNGPSSGHLTVTNCVISENSADDNGGGVTQTNGSLTITGSVISDNYGHLAGGGIRYYTLTDTSVLTITDSVISDNSAADGGGIYTYGFGVATVTNSEISGNEAVQGGGINNGGTLTITHCTITENSVSGYSEGSMQYYSGNGGGINNSGTLTVTHSTISGNTADSGGGINNFGWSGGGTLTVIDCTITDNTASDSGGGINNSGGTLTVTDSRIVKNSATLFGGGIYNSGSVFDEGTLNVSNSTISENVATSNGGGIFSSTGTFALTDCTISENIGGGIYNASTFTITNSTISENTGGGGIYNGSTLTVTKSTISGNTNTGYSSTSGGGGVSNSGTLIMTQSTISGNSATMNGGGIYNRGTSGTLTLSDCKILENTVTANGAGIYNSAAMEVTNCTISGNSATSGGGGIYNNSGTLTLSDCKILENTVTANGAGIYNSAAMEVTNCTISGNSATSGGGIYNNSGTLTVTDSTISGNTGKSGGGGIYSGSGAIAVTNCMILENTASISGGGIYSGSGQFTVTNCTILGNNASGSGGGIRASGTTTLYNTIVAKNSSDIDGTFIGSNNLIGNGTGQSSLIDRIDGNLIGTPDKPIDPMLGEWSEDSATFGTPLPGSPVINAGNNEYVTETTDILKNSRIQDGTVDIGAVEGTPFVLRSGVTYAVTSLEDVINPNDGKLTFREAFEAANRNIAVGNAPAGSFSEKDTIVFAEGLSGTIKLGGQELAIIGSVDILGSGTGKVVFDAEGLSRVFLVSAGIAVNLSGITITGGKEDNGGGVCNYGTLTITNSTISGNTASSGTGGGIYNSGTLTVTNSTIAGNIASSTGGGIYTTGETTLYNTIVVQNSIADIYRSSGTISGSSNLSTFAGWTTGDNFLYDPDLPLFEDAKNGNYRLTPDSQAVNKGNNDYALLAELDENSLDLAGNRRIIGASIDIGAYESLYSFSFPKADIYQGNVIFDWDVYGDGRAIRVTWISGGTATVLGTFTGAGTYRWDTTLHADAPGILRLEYLDENNRVISTGDYVSTIINDPAVVVHRGEITANETWSNDKIHLVVGRLDVKDGAALTIADATFVKFWKNAYINVDAGTNLNIGSYAILTRAEDDTVGGDTNKDGDLSVPQTGNTYFRGTGVMQIDSTVELRYVPLTRSGTISVSETWLSGQVYHITGNLTVASGATLTILPGAILKFDSNCSLTVNSGGTLIAEGTAANPIVFTSIKDDEYGGDTNDDEDKTRPQGGDWAGIWVYGTADLKYAHLFYGGPSNERGLLQVSNNGTANLDSCVLAHSKYDGLWNWGGTIDVRNSVFYDIGLATAPYRGTQTFTNCTFSDVSYIAMYWSHWTGEATYTNCVFNNMLSNWFDTQGSNVYQTNLVFQNCAFWNKNGQDAQVVPFIGSNGNFWADPMFRDAANGDYRLRAGSPLIDAADGTKAPATDYTGAPRVDDSHIADKTGTPNADGVYADIGAFEFTDNADSTIDLEPINLQAASAATVGETVTLQWTIRNNGSDPAVGTWTDRILLVSDTGQVVTVADITHSGSIIAGNLQTFYATVVVPNVAAGNWRFAVQVNVNRNIFEGTANENNRIDAVVGTSIAVPLLTERDFTLALVKGESQLYRVEIPAGQAYYMTANSTEAISMYVSENTAPTATSYDYAASAGVDGNYALYVPASSSARTVYLLVAAGSKAASVTLSAKNETLGLAAVTSEAAVSNKGSSTIGFIGGGFDSTMTVTLKQGGTTITGTNLSVTSPSSASATFDLQGQAAGTYDLVITKDGVTKTLASAVQVKADGVGAQLTASLDIPSAVRAGRVYLGYIVYENTGDCDMLAPVFILDLPAGGKVSLTSDMEGADNSLQVIGIGDSPAGILKPGESARIPFYFLAGTNNNIKLSGMVYGDKPLDGPWTDWQDYHAAIAQAVTTINLRGQANYSVSQAYQLARGTYYGENVAAYSGYLRSSTTNEALANKTLVATWTVGTETFSSVIRTDETGWFSLEWLPENVEITLSSSDVFGLSVTTFRITNGDINGAIVTAKTYGRISGRVTYADGSSAAEQMLKATNSAGDSIFAVTDSGGKYSFENLDWDSWSVEVVDLWSNAQAAARSVIVNSGEPLTGINFSIPVTERISGQVRDKDGNVIADAFVEIWNTANELVALEKTDEDGNYFFDLPAGTYFIAVYAESVQFVSQKIIITENAATILNFIASTASVSGKVYVSPGVAASGGMALICAVNENDDPDFPYVPLVVEIGEDGSYAFESLPAGLYRVAVQTESGTAFFEIRLAEGQTVSQDVILSAQTDLTLQVVFGNAIPAGEEVYVLLVSSDGTVQMLLQLESDGTLALGRIPQGTYHITVLNVDDGILTEEDVTLNMAAQTAALQSLHVFPASMQNRLMAATSAPSPLVPGKNYYVTTLRSHYNQLMRFHDSGEHPYSSPGIWYHCSEPGCPVEARNENLGTEINSKLREWDTTKGAFKAALDDAKTAIDRYWDLAMDKIILEGAATAVAVLGTAFAAVGAPATIAAGAVGLLGVIQTELITATLMQALMALRDKENWNREVQTCLQQLQSALVAADQRAAELKALHDDPVWSKKYEVCPGHEPEPEQEPIAETRPSVPQSCDPNEIAGPIGYDFETIDTGTPEEPYLVITTPNWITDDRDQTITVYFENKPSAAAAAQEVFVTMQMPEQWDWSTFTLNEICIGNQIFTSVAGSGEGTWLLQQDSTGEQIQLVVTFDAGTGLAEWYMRSYVSSTADHFPASAYDGFLPPNDDTQRGEGYITFGIRMNDGLATDSVVESYALIVFDTNDPIVTNVWKNTIDSDRPTSSVTPFTSSQVEANFTVRWSGTDAGSGIAYYDIYVSVDGGEFVKWLDKVTFDYAVYEGEMDRTYSFYSVAYDNVGLVEEGTKSAEATVTVNADTANDQLWLDNFLVSHPDLTDSIVTWVDGRITWLDLSEKGLTGTLDVSALTALQTLKCRSNQLTALNVSGCTSLTYLDCDENQLTTLDVTNNTALRTFYCSLNQLTTLDVSNNMELTVLSCYSNQLTELDVSKHTILGNLYCEANQLTTLNLYGTPLADFNSAIKTDVAAYYRYHYSPSDHYLNVDKTVTLLDTPTEDTTGELKVTFRMLENGSTIPTADIANPENYQPNCNIDWVDEWSSFYIDIWATSLDSSGITAFGNCVLNFNPNLFRIESITKGAAVADISTDWSKVDDGAITLSGTSQGTGGGNGEYTLLARVLVRPANGNGTSNDVGIDLSDGYASPVKNVFSFGEDILIETVDAPNKGGIANVNPLPDLDVYPVVYDFNDSGKIDFNDLLIFLDAYGKDITDISTSWKFDVNHSGGKINFNDLLVFLGAYGTSRTKAQNSTKTKYVKYASNFPDEWTTTGISNFLMLSDQNVLVNNTDEAFQKAFQSEFIQPVPIAQTSLVGTETYEFGEQNFSRRSERAFEFSDSTFSVFGAGITQKTSRSVEIDTIYNFSQESVNKNEITSIISEPTASLLLLNQESLQDLAISLLYDETEIEEDEDSQFEEFF